MALQNQSLVLDLIEWIGETPRPYAEVISAWRTSCPRLTIWEDAVDAGFVAREQAEDGHPMVRATPAGQAFLARHRPHPQAAG
jgi:hypothetical protein